MWQDLPIGQKRRTFAERVPNLPKHGTHDMTTIHLPHPVLAPAAVAIETALHFEIIDTIEMQSYAIQPIALGFATIGRHGDDLRAAPAAAYIEWDDAHYLAVIDAENHLVDVWDVTANAICERVGRKDLASAMFPVLRAARAAHRPDAAKLGHILRDTVFDVLELSAALRKEVAQDELVEVDFSDHDSQRACCRIDM